MTTTRVRMGDHDDKRAGADENPCNHAGVLARTIERPRASVAQRSRRCTQGMPAARRMSLRDRLLRAGLQARIVAGTALLVLVCGGFFAYRAVDAISDAYRWNGESEAEAVAHSFARSLAPRDLDDIERIRARLARLSGAHPQLISVAAWPARPDTARVADYELDEDHAVLRFPILDG